jgi:hypothetical protein
MNRRFLLLLTVPWLLIGLGSCSSFDRQWNTWRPAPAAKSGPLPTADHPTATGIGGRWKGSWKSSVNNHTGPLRCIVTPDSANPGIWHFRYRATWAGVLSATFEISCTARRNARGEWAITGASDLGKLYGGRFSHDAVVRGNAISAEYRSTMDRGIFTLQRVDDE